MYPDVWTVEFIAEGNRYYMFFKNVADLTQAKVISKSYPFSPNFYTFIAFLLGLDTYPHMYKCKIWVHVMLSS